MIQYVAFFFALAIPRLFSATSRSEESIHRAIFAAATIIVCLFAPINPLDGDVTQAHQVVYCMQFGFYLQEMLVLYYRPQKRPDYWIIMAHHILTLILLTLSMICGKERYGVAIILGHEPSDFFLELAKVANYTQSFWQVPLFLALLLSWIVGRFGGLIYVTAVQFDYSVKTLVFCLLILLSMNVYWFFLIIKAAIHRRDPREKVAE